MTTTKIEECFTVEELAEEFGLLPQWPVWIVRDTPEMRKFIKQLTHGSLKPGSILPVPKGVMDQIRNSAILRLED